MTGPKPSSALSVLSFSGEHRFLSNFYACGPILFEGHLYPTVEHAYQASKTLPGQRAPFRDEALSASRAKAMGGKVPMRKAFPNERLAIMLQLLRCKFSPGSKMAQKLLATGDMELIEGNYWHDTYWGVCGGVGENHLGRLLMQVRAELKKAQFVKAA